MVVAIHSLTSAALVADARERLPRGHGRAHDIYRLAMTDGRFAPDAFDLGPRAIEAWRENYSFDLPEVMRVIEEVSDTGATRKAILRLRDGLECECVSIPMGRGRSTLCISSQVGCKMGCRFCETGLMGLLRHLSTEEIIGQFLVARHVLGWPVHNLVFMGMGEALDNFDCVAQALRVLTDSGGLAMGQHRITVCTVGHIDGIRRLSTLGMKRLNLSISLNAAFDELRADLMPVHRRSSLNELQRVLADYRPRRNFCLGLNYCLMPGINATQSDARAITEFCGPLERVLVNLIPYNPGSVPLTRVPTEDEIVEFIGWLREAGLPVRRRITKGRDVMAACGQLGNRELRTSRRQLAQVDRSEAR